MQDNVSDKVLSLLGSNVKVQAFRVTDAGGLRPDPAHDIAGEFVRGAPGLELNPAQVAKLKALLFDEKSYRFAEDISRCRFVPHASFQLQSGIDTLDVVVGFTCTQLVFISGKPGGRWLPQGSFDVKPIRAALLELAKATLPNDTPTQKLK